MNNKLFKSISFRIGIIFSLSTICILIMMGFFIHKLVMHHFETQDRTQLEGKIQLIQNLLQQHPKNSPELDLYLKDALVGHHDLMVQIERPAGQILFSSASSIINTQQLIKSANNPWIKWKIKNKTYRGMIYNTDINKNTEIQSVRIIVGIDTSEHLHFLNDFKRQLFYIGLAGTICLMFLGWFATWRGLSDLAHEIRTPINNLMTQTQVCLARKRDTSTYQEVLFSNLEELERLARMVSDMLFLAKAEHGLKLQNLQNIDLVKEVTALFDFYDALAAEKNMTLQQTGSGNVKGDPAMLRRALSNLLSNAVKYGNKNSTIRIKLQQNLDNTIFSIENEGPEISPEQLSRLFDRFYRTDASRQRTEEGTGLGLAITKSILDMLGATIQAESLNGRIIFTIVFQSESMQGESF